METNGVTTTIGTTSWKIKTLAKMTVVGVDTATLMTTTELGVETSATDDAAMTTVGTAVTATLLQWTKTS